MCSLQIAVFDSFLYFGICPVFVMPFHARVSWAQCCIVLSSDFCSVSLSLCFKTISVSLHVILYDTA